MPWGLTTALFGEIELFCDIAPEGLKKIESMIPDDVSGVKTITLAEGLADKKIHYFDLKKIHGNKMNGGCVIQITAGFRKEAVA